MTNRVGAQTLSMSIQVAAGSTHAVYYKTLKHAVGIEAVCMDVFMDTIYYMYPIVKSIIDDICEAAKQDMKDKKDDELGSWKRADVVDGTWQTCGCECHIHHQELPQWSSPLLPSSLRGVCCCSDNTCLKQPLGCCVHGW